MPRHQSSIASPAAGPVDGAVGGAAVPAARPCSRRLGPSTSWPPKMARRDAGGTGPRRPVHRANPVPGRHARGWFRRKKPVKAESLKGDVRGRPRRRGRGDRGLIPPPRGRRPRPAIWAAACCSRPFALDEEGHWDWLDRQLKLLDRDGRTRLHADLLHRRAGLTRLSARGPRSGRAPVRCAWSGDRGGVDRVDRLGQRGVERVIRLLRR